MSPKNRATRDRIRRDAKRVSDAEGVHLRSSELAGRREKIALRDRTVAPDPQDLAAQIERVARGTAGVEGLASDPAVERRASVGLERIGVVARGDEQRAVGRERERATFVTATPLARDAEEHAGGAEIHAPVRQRLQANE